MEHDKMIDDEIIDLQKRIDSAKQKNFVCTNSENDVNKCFFKDVSLENSGVLVSGKDGKLHTLVSLELLNYLIMSLKKAQEDNFNLRLEKTIWKYVPVDFADAWAVVMDEVKLQTEDGKRVETANINLNHLVKGIKKKHPNLFLNIDDFLPGEFQQIN